MGQTHAVTTRAYLAHICIAFKNIMRLNAMNFKLLILIVLLLFVASCSITRPTITQLSSEPPIFMVAHPLTYKLDGTDVQIQVPKGFVTDLASIPRALWWWQAPHEGTLAPAILHDYLYWVQTCSKDEADAVMYLAMEEVGIVGNDLKAIYAGIRTPLAEDSWKKNGIARAEQGEMRLFKRKYASMIMESAIKPGFTLKEIQRDAMAEDGMTQIIVPIVQVKIACKLALQELERIDI